MMTDTAYIQEAIALAKQGEAAGEVPIGAIVVLNHEIIACAYNQPIHRHDPTAHAEILALRQAGEAIGNYRLVDATLYVTLEPCPMCAAAMVHARIKRLVFGAKDPRQGAACSVFSLLDGAPLNHTVEYTPDVESETCQALLKDFFKRKR